MYDERIDSFDEAEPGEKEAVDPGQEAVPAYRFMHQPLPRLRPVSRVLAKALQIHHGLFLYYARPLFQMECGGFGPFCSHGDYLGCQCGGSAFGDGPLTQRPAEDVLPLVGCLDRQAQTMEQGGRTYGLVGYDTREPPPEDPAELNKPLAGGWQLHPMAIEPLEACGQQIRELVEVLLRAEPEGPVASMLDHARSLSRLRLGPIVGFEGQDLVAWRYPHDLKAAIQAMPTVQAFEQQVAMGGWEPTPSARSAT